MAEAIVGAARAAVAGISDEEMISLGAGYGYSAVQQAVRRYARPSVAGWEKCLAIAAAAGVSTTTAARMVATMMVESGGNDVVSPTGDVSPIQVSAKTFPDFAKRWEAKKDPRDLGAFYSTYLQESQAWVRGALAGTPLAQSALARLLFESLRYNASVATTRAKLREAVNIAGKSGVAHPDWIVSITSYGTPPRVRAYPFDVLFCLVALSERGTGGTPTRRATGVA